MTVKELIEKLEKYDKNQIITIIEVACPANRSGIYIGGNHNEDALRSIVPRYPN